MGEKIKLIVVLGCPNAGKTTTIGMVYRKLFEFPQTKLDHIFKKKKVSEISLEYEKNGGVKDFNAIVTVNNVKVGIISYGDELSAVEEGFSYFFKEGVSVIVCAARFRKRKSKVYVYLERLPNCEIVYKEFVMNDHQKVAEEVKKPSVEKILGNVFELTREINEKRKTCAQGGLGCANH
jgi:adenylate kinase family enzyme